MKENPKARGMLGNGFISISFVIIRGFRFSFNTIFSIKNRRESVNTAGELKMNMFYFIHEHGIHISNYSHINDLSVYSIKDSTTFIKQQVIKETLQL